MVNVDGNISLRINLMRIMLIAGIVFVHIPFDPATAPFNGTYGSFDWLRVFLRDVLFRMGVPCLSAISGYLLFRKGLEAFDYRKVIVSKAGTVLLPFLIWNSAVFLVVYLAQSRGIGFGYLHDVLNADWRQTLTDGFAAEGMPVNIPLYFLRDLFVCILISPLLAWLIKRFPLQTLTVLLLVAVLPDVTLGFVLKKSILFSFSFGIYASLYKLDLKAFDRYALPIAVSLLAASALLASGLYATGPDFPVAYDTARNILAIVGPVGFWVASASLIETKLGKRLAQTGGLSFWIFCAHYPLLVFFWMAWNRTGIEFYPLFYCAAFVLVFVILATSNLAVRNTLPRLYGVLTGGRNKTRSIEGGAAVAASPAQFVQQQR